MRKGIRTLPRTVIIENKLMEIVKDLKEPSTRQIAKQFVKELEKDENFKNKVNGRFFDEKNIITPDKFNNILSLVRSHLNVMVEEGKLRKEHIKVGNTLLGKVLYWVR